MKMRLHILLFLSFCCFYSQKVEAQKNALSLPVKVSLFAESIGLPGVANLFNGINPGIMLGTEVYYANKPQYQLLQTLDIGYYHHSGWADGWIIKSNFGYRKYFGGFYPEVMIGLGYTLQHSKLNQYQNTKSGHFEPASSLLHRALMTLSGGLGYRLPSGTALFTSYEVLGEYPFNYNGNPVLPRRALHIGVKFNFNQFN